MARSLPDFSFETPLWDQGYAVVGLDEVGRGPLAGPVTVGAVSIMLPHSQNIQEWISMGINDSKKVSQKKRDLLSPLIAAHSLAYAVCSSSVDDINAFGIVKAIQLAAIQALTQIRQSIDPAFKLFLLADAFAIPGIKNIGYEGQKAVIQGDGKILSVAAASIIAKVERDNHMSILATQYPEYGFERNKGYGTAEHLASIRKNGPTPLHRHLFIRSVLNSMSP